MRHGKKEKKGVKATKWQWIKMKELMFLTIFALLIAFYVAVTQAGDFQIQISTINHSPNTHTHRNCFEIVLISSFSSFHVKYKKLGRKEEEEE